MIKFAEKTDIMEALSVRDYRNNLAAYFEKADEGTPVLIRRKNKLYALTSIGKEDLMLTPELQKRIDEAREAYRCGNVVSVKSKEDLHSFLDSL